MEGFSDVVDKSFDVDQLPVAALRNFQRICGNEMAGIDAARRTGECLRGGGGSV